MGSPDGGNRYEYANGVLRNLLGICDAEDLKHVEATFTALRLAELAEHPVAGIFDTDHLKAIHHHIFQDIYTWAGEFRQVDISKEKSRFAHFAFLEDQARLLFDHLAHEQHLRDLPPDQFAARGAYYLGDLNALHPFREGNGRTQRVFLSALAQQAGYRLEWARVTVEQMTAASVRSLFQADNTEFEAILHNILSPAS